jgi:hypothetical protein
VEGQAAPQRELGDVADRVDHAMRVLRRGGSDEHGVRVDQRLEILDVGAVAGGQAREAHLEAEVLRRLVEGGVDRLGRDDVRLAELLVLAACAIPRRLHREQDRLGAAARHRADDVGAAVDHRCGHADDLGLHLLQALEGHRVEEVLREEELVGGLQRLLVFLARVVDEAERTAVAPVGVALAEALHALDQLGPRHAAVGNRDGHRGLI